MCHKVSFNYNHKYNSHFFWMRLSILRKILVYKVVKKPSINLQYNRVYKSLSAKLNRRSTTSALYGISSCINCMFVLQRLDITPWGQISQLCQNSGLVPIARLWRHHYRDRRARMAASISILPSLYNLSKCFSLHWGPKKKKRPKSRQSWKKIRRLKGWPNRSDNVADPAQTDSSLWIGISGICTLDDSS